MKHNMGPLANAFATTNTRMETNVSIVQTNLLIVTLQNYNTGCQNATSNRQDTDCNQCARYIKTITHIFLPPKHPAGNHPTDMYYADDDGHQQDQNQNEDDINEYHGDIHDNYHQEQAQEPPNNLPAHEPTDYTDHHPPVQDYQYNKDDKFIPTDYSPHEDTKIAPETIPMTVLLTKNTG